MLVLWTHCTSRRDDDRPCDGKGRWRSSLSRRQRRRCVHGVQWIEGKDVVADISCDEADHRLNELCNIRIVRRHESQAITALRALAEQGRRERIERDARHRDARVKLVKLIVIITTVVVTCAFIVHDVAVKFT
jgi:hypothetical protein